MFARFERDIHAMEADGRPLSADALDESYWTPNRRYHGPHWCSDRRSAREWSRIPHFYYNFYVYKYATSYCAAQAWLFASCPVTARSVDARLPCYAPADRMIP